MNQANHNPVPIMATNATPVPPAPPEQRRGALPVDGLHGHRVWRCLLWILLVLVQQRLGRAGLEPVHPVHPRTRFRRRWSGQRHRGQLDDGGLFGAGVHPHRHPGRRVPDRIRRPEQDRRADPLRDRHHVVGAVHRAWACSCTPSRWPPWAAFPAGLARWRCP